MYSDDEIKGFYQNYRDSLDRQYQSATQALEQQRKNAQTSIMSNANVAGTMYSNLPARDKIKYEQSTYMPALTTLNTTYRTGLDKLRDNIVKYQNSIRSIQQAISDMNES